VITFTNTQIALTDVRIDIDKTGKHCYENFVRKLCLLSIQKFKVSILVTLTLKYYYTCQQETEQWPAGYRLYVIQGNHFGKVKIRKPSLKSVNEPS
jgi:hypothetical protein